MVDVEAKKPDEIVDVENRFRTKLAPQLLVDDQEQDVKHCENVPPKHGCVGHLLINKSAGLVLDPNTCLVAHHISGVFANGGESLVGTLAKQILIDLPWEVDMAL